MLLISADHPAIAPLDPYERSVRLNFRSKIGLRRFPFEGDGALRYDRDMRDRHTARKTFQGLQCDGAAGSINHSLTTATPNATGGYDVTLQPFGHNFTTVDLHPVQTFTVPSDPDIQHEYGDLTSCGVTLFP